MTTPEEVALYLEQLGLGIYRPSSPDATIHLLKLPQSPDVCMAITFYPGPEPDGGQPYDSPRCQIRCRGTKSNRTRGYELAKQVYDALHGHGSLYLPGGTWMVQCLGVQDGPAPMGFDQNERDEWVVNVQFEFRTSARRARAF